MEFKEAMRMWKRMCKAHKRCGECPMFGKVDVCPAEVWDMEVDPEAILAKWAAEHPERTFMDDFFAKHPKAPRRSPDYPEACARVVGYISECPATVNNCVGCNDCWRRPLEEVR